MLSISRHLIQSSLCVLVLAGMSCGHAHATTINPSVIIVTTSSRADVTANVHEGPNNPSSNSCTTSGTNVSAVGCGGIIGSGNMVVNAYINATPGLGSIDTALSGIGTAMGQPPDSYYGPQDVVAANGDIYGQILSNVQVLDPKIAYLQFSDTVTGELDVGCFQMTNTNKEGCYYDLTSSATLDFAGREVTFAYNNVFSQTGSQVISLGGAATYDIPVPPGGTTYPLSIQNELQIVQMETYAYDSSVTTTVTYFAQVIDPITIQALDANMNVIPDATFEYVSALPESPVPEPSTLVMLGTGLIGIGAALRRRLTA